MTPGSAVGLATDCATRPSEDVHVLLDIILTFDLKLGMCMCFHHDLKLCMSFIYNSQINFFTFSRF